MTEIVRDDEHLWRAIQYIGRNPRSAGIAPKCWRRWIHPGWESLGWRFAWTNDARAGRDYPRPTKLCRHDVQ